MCQRIQVGLNFEWRVRSWMTTTYFDGVLLLLFLRGPYNTTLLHPPSRYLLQLSKCGL